MGFSPEFIFSQSIYLITVELRNRSHWPLVHCPQFLSVKFIASWLDVVLQIGYITLGRFSLLPQKQLSNYGRGIGGNKYMSTLRMTEDSRGWQKVVTVGMQDKLPSRWAQMQEKTVEEEAFPQWWTGIKESPDRERAGSGELKYCF